MDEMEDKLGAILNNPQLMQQIMSMAQTLGQPPAPEQPKESPPQQLITGMDPNMLQKVYTIAKQSGIDRNQQALLKALSPYLSRDRITKLEKAMRAAKIAGVASAALGSAGLSFLTGR